MVKSNRVGTSVAAFDARFPDSDACLNHLLRVRFGEFPACPGCGCPTKFLKVRGRNRYISSCCFNESINPATGTIFSRTRIPLLDWFRCILYFTNSSSGISISFVMRHFGLSKKAAFRINKKIRSHFREIDSNIKLGKSKCVYIDEAKIKNVASNNERRMTPVRLLVAFDGDDIFSFPLPKGRMKSVSKSMFEKFSDNSNLIIRNDALYKKLTGYRNSKTKHNHPIFVSDNSDSSNFNHIDSYVIKLKQFIFGSHLWISERYIDDYIAHFNFIYRRRNSGSSIFCEAISKFY